MEGKRRIIKKFEQLSADMAEQLKSSFPEGFEDNLITFANPKGEIEVALPFETEDTYYLIKMPKVSRAAEDEEDETDNNPLGEFDNFENLHIDENVADDDDD